MGTPGAVDPRALDDDNSEDNEKAESLLELFWDRAVLFLSTAIVALTAVDILTELLRGGSNVVCFFPSDLNVSDDQVSFANSYCSQSVPDTQYLPIFVLIHGVLIGAWHYLWKSSFRTELHLFLSHAQDLEKINEEKTGEYPLKNQILVKKMMVEFSKYSRRGVFTWYQIKLTAQLLTAVASLLSSILIFTDFDVEFSCPRNEMDVSWPFPGSVVTCIFSSLRLFALVRVFDILLLSLIILTLLWAVLWSFWRHPYELGARNVALFAFTTGLDGSYFVPRPKLGNPAGFCRAFFSRRIFHELYLRFFSPRITTDLDFLLILLYRTDSSLAHSFKEGQVYFDYEALQKLDESLLSTRNYREGSEAKKPPKLEKELCDGLLTGWNIELEKDLDPPDIRRKIADATVPPNMMAVPDNIRGAVLGLTLRMPTKQEEEEEEASDDKPSATAAEQSSAKQDLSPPQRNNDRAISVSFGSPGFSILLSRVFNLVGAMNFDSAFKSDKSFVEVERPPFNVTRIRCYDDLFSRGGEDSSVIEEFNEKTSNLWEEDDEEDYYKISFMVVGPIVELKHVAAVDGLLKTWDDRFCEDAVLVIIHPVKIEGTDGTEEFREFEPPSSFFKEFDPRVYTKVTTAQSPLIWGNNEDNNQRSTPRHFHLHCGNTVGDFSIRTYHWKEESAGDDAGSASEGGADGTEEQEGDSGGDTAISEEKLIALETEHKV